MFEQVVQSLRKATESSVQMQQEMFKKWVGLWSGAPGWVPEPAQKYQKQFTDFFQETMGRQRQLAEAQFKTGLELIEKSFQIGEVKCPDELRARTIELWKQCFEAVWQGCQAQAKEFQTAVEKWSEAINKPAA
jgi:hypothetical protein